MLEKLNELEQKIDALINKVEKLTEENNDLYSSNKSLKDELEKARQNLESMELAGKDQKEKVTSKLTNILGRLDQLEKLA